MLQGKRFAFVGAGTMAEALIKGLLASGKVKPEDICASRRKGDALAMLAEAYGIRASQTNASCVEDAQIIVLAVKPQVMPEALADIASKIAPDALVVSIAAGITTASLEQGLRPGTRIVRAMPNTAAQVGRSATGIAGGVHATAQDLAAAKELFEAVGRVVTVDEIQLDAVTGLSGSGPAYIFLIIEALADAGVKVGLARTVALELAAQTLLGSAHMLLETGEHPGRLKDQVATPGGTTIAGLHTLEAGGLRVTLMNAVEAATRRARELGETKKPS